MAAKTVFITCILFSPIIFSTQQQGSLSKEISRQGIPLLYDDYSLFQVMVDNQKQLQRLIDVINKNHGQVRPWLLRKSIDEPQQMLVGPSDVHEATDMWSKFGLQFNQSITNIRNFIKYDGAGENINEDHMKCRPFDVRTYHSYQDIENQLECLAHSYKSFVEIKVIGETIEKRPIYVLIISNENHRQEKRTPAFWIDGGIHAREWISPAVAMMIVQKIIYDFKAGNNKITNITWFVAPVINPDGYTYSRTQDRLWRKNRRHFNQQKRDTICQGVDLNRNFGYKWGTVRKGSEKCTEDYHGETAFSEPETQAVAKFLQQHKSRLRAALSLHSYGQMILYPWDFSAQERDVQSCVSSVASQMSAAMRNVNYRLYRYGQTHEILYPASGTFTDWLVGSLGINLAYVLELPDKGNMGFLAPSTEIVPTFKETWQAVQVLRDALEVDMCSSKQHNHVIQQQKLSSLPGADSQKLGDRTKNGVTHSVTHDYQQLQFLPSAGNVSQEAKFENRLEDAVDQLLAQQPGNQLYLEQLSHQDDDPTTIKESRVRGDPSIHRIQITTRSPSHGSSFRNYSSKLGSHILICINCTNLVDRRFKGPQGRESNQISLNNHYINDDKSGKKKKFRSFFTSRKDEPVNNYIDEYNKNHNGKKHQVLNKENFLRNNERSVINERRVHRTDQKQLSPNSIRVNTSRSRYKKYPPEHGKFKNTREKNSVEKNDPESSEAKISLQGLSKGQSALRRNFLHHVNASTTPDVHSIMTLDSAKQESQRKPLKSHQTSVPVNSVKLNNNWIAQQEKLSNERTYKPSSVQSREHGANELKYDNSVPGYFPNDIKTPRHQERQPWNLTDGYDEIQQQNERDKGKKTVQTTEHYQKEVTLVRKRRRLPQQHQTVVTTHVHQPPQQSNFQSSTAPAVTRRKRVEHWPHQNQRRPKVRVRRQHRKQFSEESVVIKSTGINSTDDSNRKRILNVQQGGIQYQTPLSNMKFDNYSATLKPPHHEQLQNWKHSVIQLEPQPDANSNTKPVIKRKVYRTSKISETSSTKIKNQNPKMTAMSLSSTRPSVKLIDNKQNNHHHATQHLDFEKNIKQQNKQQVPVREFYNKLPEQPQPATQQLPQDKQPRHRVIKRKNSQQSEIETIYRKTSVNPEKSSIESSSPPTLTTENLSHLDNYLPNKILRERISLHQQDGQHRNPTLKRMQFQYSRSNDDQNNMDKNHQKQFYDSQQVNKFARNKRRRHRCKSADRKEYNGKLLRNLQCREHKQRQRKRENMQYLQDLVSNDDAYLGLL